MGGKLPLVIELKDILGIFGPNKFTDKLKLLTKLEYALLKDSNFPGRPLLKNHFRINRTNQHIQILLLIQQVNSIQIELDGFLFLILGGFEDLLAGGQDGQDWVFQALVLF